MITGLLLAFPIGFGIGFLVGDRLPFWIIAITSALLAIAVSTICQHVGLP